MCFHCGTWKSARGIIGDYSEKQRRFAKVNAKNRLNRAVNTKFFIGILDTCVSLAAHCITFCLFLSIVFLRRSGRWFARSAQQIIAAIHLHLQRDAHESTEFASGEPFLPEPEQVIFWEVDDALSRILAKRHGHDRELFEIVLGLFVIFGRYCSHGAD